MNFININIVIRAIIRDIVSDFSDEDDIELIGDEEEDDVEIGISELHCNITYANPSWFFTYINSEAGCDYRPGSTTLRNDNDLFVGMQFESKESTLWCSYNDLPRWMNTVQIFSPITIVRYETSRHYVDDIENPTNVILDRVFWAFKPCIEGFAYCKLILQVDETFLTGKYNGTLLIASSQDGNRRIFPVAFAIVEGETKEVRE
ncbi:hypothetical protein Lal_00049761 [Lupinus albus]|nr:hypothetical protein Lal_00049761 [Lupinus albus]